MFCAVVISKYWMSLLKEGNSLVVYGEPCSFNSQNPASPWLPSYGALFGLEYSGLRKLINQEILIILCKIRDELSTFDSGLFL